MKKLCLGILLAILAIMSMAIPAFAKHDDPPPPPPEPTVSVDPQSATTTLGTDVLFTATWDNVKGSHYYGVWTVDDNGDDVISFGKDDSSNTYNFVSDSVGDYTVSFTLYEDSHLHHEIAGDSTTVTVNDVPPPPPVVPPPARWTGEASTTGNTNPLAITDKGGNFYAFVGNGDPTWVGWGSASIYSGTTISELNETGELNGKQYKITVPSGTTITGATPTTQSNYIQVKAWENDVVKWSPTTLNFSKPVTFSKYVGGSWVVVQTFTKIVAGMPQ